jgi:hypothetical protein
VVGFDRDFGIMAASDRLTVMRGQTIAPSRYNELRQISNKPFAVSLECTCLASTWRKIVRESTRRRIAASSTETISVWAPHVAHQPDTFRGLLMNNMRSVSMVISVRFLFMLLLTLSHWERDGVRV